MARALTCHERLLHNAARSGDVSTVRRVLQYHRDAVDVNSKDMQFYGYSALHWAAFKGFLDILIALVDDGGADVNNITVAHWTALHLASQAGHGRVCRWLIESGEANLELLTTDAKSATTVAADQSTSAIILGASERSRRRLLCIRITGCHRHLSGPLCDRQLVRLIMSHIKVSESLGTM
ncbi:hypothetical protein PBRA_004387 [Plasmodiophora brassicae]|nr:hypothetical protein PBRA_004387 [Plasmodiophora brassicae]